MRILSIDFDYFVLASDLVRALFFPDGGCEFGNLDSVVWQSCYASSYINRMPLEDCATIDLPKLCTVASCLNRQADHIPYMIADSHKDIYDFVKEILPKGDTAIIVNIDYHHDSASGSDDIHCGNWLRHLMDEGVVKLAFWCSRRGSDHTSKPGGLRRISFSDAMRGNYDAVFICRSGWWVPPHLDVNFIANFITPACSCQHTGPIWISNMVKESRYTETFWKNNRALEHLIKEVCSNGKIKS